MRHGKKTIKLNKSSSHRRSMWANMTISFVKSEKVNTTVAKAKLLRSYVERLITRAKRGNLADQRYLLSTLYNNSEAVKKLMDLGERYKERSGGYTRVLKSGFRYGDNAPMAYIELLA